MWIRLDDTFWTHPKLERLSDRAYRLYLRSIGYAAQHLTDGVIDQTALRTLGAARKTCDELVTSGCWDIVPDGGYVVHDYLEFQLSRERVLEGRRQAAERQAKRRSVANKHPETGRFT